ncbi:MAG TPA: polyhydroxyalkanoic acid system family protein [Polyangia bacterium]|nr:polyhydroxyalkanoic acid system family protein [Polyangia bacterium]
MPKFEVDIPCSLSPEVAKERLAGATPKLEKDYGATCTWKSDAELLVSRKGLDARVSIEPARVHVDLNLGFLLTPLANAIKTGITKELTGLLAG